MKIFSPAKINLFLDLLEKRKDGYHEIETIMQALDFCDIIDIQFTETKKIELFCKYPDFPLDSTNLIWKSTELFFKETGIHFPGITYTIEKNIPIGGGLGGGSSNAVTVLNALNDYYNKPLKSDELKNLAAILGSDTAFFIQPATWLCKGRGEKLINKIDSKKWTYLLLIPKINCSTKKVYGNYIFGLTKTPAKHNFLTFNISNGSLEEYEQCIFNDLKEAIFRSYSEMKELVNQIEKLASKKVFISGSGSTLFMVFNNDEEAMTIKKLLEFKHLDGVKFVLAHTLSEY